MGAPSSSLPNTYNIENTRELIHKLKHTPISPHYKLASIVIANLYTNIPVKETRGILFAKLEQNGTDSKVIQELMSWYDTITSQNYFTHSGNTQIQKDGLAMGAPSSGLISELFLQQMEHLHLTHLQTKRRISDYCHSIDDILLVFDSNHTDIQSILSEFKAIHQNLKFTAETEIDNKINYLDITMHRTPTDWKISIYRKPTFTDTIIPYTSNHPTQRKFTAIRFLYNRLNMYDCAVLALAFGYLPLDARVRTCPLQTSLPLSPHPTVPVLPKPEMVPLGSLLFDSLRELRGQNFRPGWGDEIHVWRSSGEPKRGRCWLRVWVDCAC
jgi:hypothetical protein